jgi:hypothetical protein
MFWRNSNLSLATALLLLVAISGSSFGALSTGKNRCAEAVASTSSCAASNNCCCGVAPDRACGCPSRDEPAESPLPVIPDDNNRTIKWVAGQILSTFEILPTLVHQSSSCAERLDFSFVERSVQSRLCIWRC